MTIHPPSPPEDPLGLVTVFETSNGALLVVARALLESAGIPCVTTGDIAQDFVGWGRFPGGYNLVTGPARIWVERRDQADAIATLRDVESA
jgi:Putative prokaryotic signal transducing protein